MRDVTVELRCMINNDTCLQVRGTNPECECATCTAYTEIFALRWKLTQVRLLHIDMGRVIRA